MSPSWRWFKIAANSCGITMTDGQAFAPDGAGTSRGEVRRLDCQDKAKECEQFHAERPNNRPRRNFRALFQGRAKRQLVSRGGLTMQRRSRAAVIACGGTVSECRPFKRDRV